MGATSEPSAANKVIPVGLCLYRKTYLSHQQSSHYSVSPVQSLPRSAGEFIQSLWIVMLQTPTVSWSKLGTWWFKARLIRPPELRTILGFNMPPFPPGSVNPNQQISEKRAVLWTRRNMARDVRRSPWTDQKRPTCIKMCIAAQYIQWMSLAVSDSTYMSLRARTVLCQWLSGSMAAALSLGTEILNVMGTISCSIRLTRASPSFSWP